MELASKDAALMPFYLSEIDTSIAYLEQLDRSINQACHKFPRSLQGVLVLNIVQDNDETPFDLLFKTFCAQHQYGGNAAIEYGDYALDLALERLVDNQLHLRQLSKKLSQFVDVKNLPSRRDVEILTTDASNNSIFRIFNAKYRYAKKALLALAIDKRFKLDDMLTLMPAISAYLGSIAQFEALKSEFPSLVNLTINSNYGKVLKEATQFKEIAFAWNQDMAGFMFDHNLPVIIGLDDNVINDYKHWYLEHFGPLNTVVRNRLRKLSQVYKLPLEGDIADVKCHLLSLMGEIKNLMLVQTTAEVSQFVEDSSAKKSAPSD